MRTSTRSSVYKLVAHDSRGRVLGSIIIDDTEQRYVTICNDCYLAVTATRSLPVCVDWIENHDHATHDSVLPTISTERDAVTVERSQDGASFA